MAVKWAPPSNFSALIDVDVISNFTLDYNHRTGNFHKDGDMIQFFLKITAQLWWKENKRMLQVLKNTWRIDIMEVLYTV